jgi:nucleotide-binding universal stress UspA family protein
MRLPTLQIKDTILAQFTKSKPDDIRSGILVPVNSTENAFNSLEYALKLAKILNNAIHLFYVIDVSVDELSESTIVAHRILEKTYNKAENCVESLKEIIEESGVKVMSAESRIGNIGSLIQKQVEYIRPGMIVIGRDCFKRSTIDHLVSNVSCPVVAIPGCASPQLPSSIILTNKHNTFSEKAIAPLIKIAQLTTRELTILRFLKFKKSKIENVAVPHISTTNVLLKIQQIEGSPSAHIVDDFVQGTTINLVCTTHQRQSLFKRFLRRSFSAEIVFKLNVPVMILCEK